MQPVLETVALEVNGSNNHEETTTSAALAGGGGLTSLSSKIAKQLGASLTSPRTLFSPRPPPSGATPSPIPNLPGTPGRPLEVSDGGLADISSMEEDQSFTRPPMHQASSFSVKRTTLARMKVLGSMRAMGRNTADSAERDANSNGNMIPEEPETTMNPAELKVVMDRGIRYFNLNPKTGMKFLKDKRVIYNKRDSPEANARRAALFLKNTRGLNKAKIGMFLGSDQPLILNEYLATFDFTSHPSSIKGIEAGFREFVSNVKPPGEGQQIDRILDAFAYRFALHCEPRFTKDAILQIAFLIIITNVTLHNPAMRGKRGVLTREEFIQAHTKDAPLKDCGTKEEFGELYDSIQRNELRYEEDREDVAGNLFSDPDASGWLEIRFFDPNMLLPRLRSCWVSKWVILSQNTLYYFKKSTDVEFEGFVTLEDLKLLTEHSTPNATLQRKANSQPPSTAPPVPPTVPEPLDGSSSLLSARSAGQRPMEATADGRPEEDVHPSSAAMTREEQEDLHSPRAAESVPRLARLISCPTFRTSQSSLNTTTASSSSPGRNGSSLSFGRSRSLHVPSIFRHSEYNTFLLAPFSQPGFVKSARLEKRRLRGNRTSGSGKKRLGQRKSTAGEVVPQQNIYIGFRTKSREEYEMWVKTLRQVGLRRTRGGITLPKSAVPAVGWGGGRPGFRLFSPTFSLPPSFSADEDDDDNGTDNNVNTTVVSTNNSSSQLEPRDIGTKVEPKPAEISLAESKSTTVMETTASTTAIIMT